MPAAEDEPQPGPKVTAVEIGGASLEVHIYKGAADGPALVFLHEGLGSAALWRDFPARLADATGLPTVVYSRRGYGTSSPRDTAYSSDFMHIEALDVLPHLLNALDIRRPILVGHSDGGSIALIHAARHPVAALVVAAPHIFVEQLSVESIAEAREAFAAADLKDKLGRYHDDPEHAFRGWNDAWLDPAFRDWDITDLLPAIRCPILAIQGESDQYGTMAQIDGIAAHAGGPVELLKLPDCGHSPHRDQPDAVLDAMARFIGRVRTEGMGETTGRGRFLEDYAEGETIVSRPYALSAREIAAFAGAYDPQPIHTDEVYAVTDGPFGEIIASGFQTVALCFKLFLETGCLEDGVSMGGPAMDDVRWLTPAYPGDTLTNHITILEARRSKSKPDRGILRVGHDLRNQRGESVTTCSTVTIVRARNTPTP